MALSDEQNAMLRLLAQGEQGYGDIAALMGLKETEVRAKVVGALAQLEAEGRPAPDIPPPIAGGARPAAEVDPPEPEPVAPVPEGADEDEDAEPAVAEAVAPQEPVEPAAKPRKATKPKAASAARSARQPVVPASRRAAAGDSSGARATAGRNRSSSAAPPPGGRTITLPTGRRAWLLGGGALAAIAIVVVVILLVSGGGGGDSTTTTSSSSQTTNANSENAAGNESNGGTKEATQAELKAVDGSEAAGLAAFGRVKNKLALQVEATGLEPTEEGTNSYTIWLAQSPNRMLPLASIGVKGSGKGANAIAAQFEVPVEVLAYLASGTFDQISITRTDNEQFEAAVAAATKAKTTPSYTGEAVLRGTIVGRIVGIAKREAEEQKGE